MANNYYYDRNGRYLGSSSNNGPSDITDAPWWFVLLICGIPFTLVFVLPEIISFLLPFVAYIKDLIS